MLSSLAFLPLFFFWLYYIKAAFSHIFFLLTIEFSIFCLKKNSLCVFFPSLFTLLLLSLPCPILFSRWTIDMRLYLALDYPFTAMMSLCYFSFHFFFKFCILHKFKKKNFCYWSVWTTMIIFSSVQIYYICYNYYDHWFCLVYKQPRYFHLKYASDSIISVYCLTYTTESHSFTSFHNNVFKW